MRVALTSLYSSEPDPDGQIAADDLRRELARALARRGHTCSVIAEHPVAATRLDGPVRWIFTPPDPLARLGRRLLARRDDALVKAPAWGWLGAVAAERPEIIHSFDLVAYGTLAGLGLLARARGSALVATFHGGAPARDPALRAVERLALRGCQRLMFTTRERGLDWVKSGALADDRRLSEVYESSSVFTPGDRAAARRSWGLLGRPALLHVGRLDAVKDPITTIEGFRRVLQVLPEAHLSLAWRGGALEPELRERARGLPISWLGPVPRARMYELYRAADLLVQSSVREVCGYAVLESLAVGTPAVLSDIPPFRRLTDGGSVGALFPVGDPEGLAAAVVRAWEGVRSGVLTPERVRRSFDERLSFDVLASEVEAVYTSALQEIRSTL